MLTVSHEQATMNVCENKATSSSREQSYLVVVSMLIHNSLTETADSSISLLHCLTMEMPLPDAVPDGNATLISTRLARGEPDNIPSFTEILYTDWYSNDLATAFYLARDTIYQLTMGAGETRPIEHEIGWKWCNVQAEDVFQSIQHWPLALIKKELFDIWRDILLLRNDGSELQIGLSWQPYRRQDNVTGNQPPNGDDDTMMNPPLQTANTEGIGVNGDPGGEAGRANGTLTPRNGADPV